MPRSQLQLACAFAATLSLQGSLAAGEASVVSLASPGYVVLERDSSGELQLLPILSTLPEQRPDFHSPGAPQRWSVDWIDLQPAFATERLACRNPERPVRCHGEKFALLPPCNSVAEGAEVFVELSLTKSASGDTPAQKGQPSRWSKLSTAEKAGVITGAPVVIAAGVAAAVVMGPVLAVAALSSPECMGWDTKWVEFDHPRFASIAESTIARAGWGTREGRAKWQAELDLLAAEHKERTVEVDRKARALVLAAEQRAKPWREFIGRSFPPPSLPVTSNGVSLRLDKSLENQRAVALEGLNARSSQLLENLRVELDELVDLWRRQALALAESSLESKKSWVELLSFVQRLEGWGAQAGDLLPRARDKLAKLEAYEAALAKQAREEGEARRRLEDDRISKFRRALRVGSDTHCGPVVELRGPMVKIAAAVAGYGTEHWVKAVQLFPPGYGCHWRNGVLQPQ